MQGFLLGPFGDFLQEPVLGNEISLFTVFPVHVGPWSVGDLYQEVGVIGPVDGAQAVLVEHLMIGDHIRKVSCPLDSPVPGQGHFPSSLFPQVLLQLL